MHVERTFTVPRPVEVVFDYLGDFTHTNQWDPGTVETKRTSGDGGLGTTYSNSSEFLGRQVDLTYETVVFERDRSLRFRGHNKSSTATDSMDFTPTSDGGTQIHYRADFEFVFPISLVAPLLVRPKLSALADETVEQLKDALLRL